MSPLARASAMISLHRSMHSRQIAAPGTAISMSTCGCALPQKLHFRLLPSTGDFRPSLSGITTSVRAARSNHVRPSSPPRTPAGPGAADRAAYDVRLSWEPRWEPRGRAALRFSGPTRTAGRNAPEVAHCSARVRMPPQESTNQKVGGSSPSEHLRARSIPADRRESAPASRSIEMIELLQNV